jgi:conjugative transfer signal peptidase TraF
LGRVGRGAIVAGATACVLAVVGHLLGLRLNLTSSIPPGIYRTTSDAVTRGAIVIACLPAEASAFAAARGFVPRGRCPDGRSPIGKTVAALPGDSVQIDSAGVSVNGHLIPNSRPLRHDSRGRPLPRLVGAYIVPPHEVWLVSSYSARSYDSRYFGGVPESLVVGRVRPVLRFR